LARLVAGAERPDRAVVVEVKAARRRSTLNEFSTTTNAEIGGEGRPSVARW